MSRNSKNARLIREAKSRSESRKKGIKGPAKTQAKHGKKRAWWQLFDTFSAAVKGGKGNRRRDADNDPQTQQAA